MCVKVFLHALVSIDNSTYTIFLCCKVVRGSDWLGQVDMLNFIHFSQCTQACMHCICHIIWPFHILRHSVFITGCYIVTQVTVSHCLNHHLLFIESAVSVILHQRRERSDANLGECAVSFPVSSIWLPNIPSSQLPLTIDRSALRLMWALNCVYTLGFASCF